jgi:hypothetical protein
LLQFSAQKAPGNEIPVCGKSFRREVEFISGQREALAGLGTSTLARRPLFRASEPDQ